ncbi:hypothetical protein ACTQ49_10690 [Luteococcus sp. Sow4_B9]|uniref:hypothetical protein n=1 Tax=Luteococcus sp. Sow4_B9 TaxID=3438792 RepID=UPI003F99BE9F
MPSYRVQMEILGLRPGHRPEAVLDGAVEAIGENFHVDDRQIDVIAQTPRITVRFTVPDSSDAEEVELARMATAAAHEAVDRVALIGREWILRRQGGRWLALPDPAR